MPAEKLAEFGTFSGRFHVMFGMWIKKWSKIRGIARHKVCMVLPISLLFEQNLPTFRALSTRAYHLFSDHVDKYQNYRNFCTPLSSLLMVSVRTPPAFSVLKENYIMKM